MLTSIAIFIIAFFATKVGLDWHARKNRRELAEAAERPALPEPRQSIDEWRQVFRETVIAAEGELSPEMEAFLEREPQPERRENLDTSADAYAAFFADWNSATSHSEVVSVVRRWLRKGLVIPLKMQTDLISEVSNSSTRNDLRALFDKQSSVAARKTKKSQTR